MVKRKKKVVNPQSFINEQARLNAVQAKLDEEILKYIDANDQKMELLRAHVMNLEEALRNMQTRTNGGYMYS